MHSPIVVRSPRAWGLRADPPPNERIDWSSWYLRDEEDEVGESGEHFEIIQVILSTLRLLLKNTLSRVASNQYIAWVPSEPLVRVSPDVYVVDWAEGEPLPTSWQTWRHDHRPPRFALEVVSDESWKKDYEENPPKYAQLGVRELLIFDPHPATEKPTSRNVEERVALQLWRRKADGAFDRVEKHDRAVDLDTLGLFAVVVEGRLRLSWDRAGQRICPTEGELADAEAGKAEAEAQRAEVEAQRAEAATRRAEAEAQRAARLAAKLEALGVSVDDT